MAICALAACSSDNDDAIVFDASAPIDAPIASIDANVSIDAPECNALEQTASEVGQVRVAEDMPAPVGGGIPDGRYHLVADVLYTGIGGASGPTTGTTTAATWMCTALECDVIAHPLTSFVDQRYNYLLSLSGTDLSITTVCPETQTLNASYTTTTDGDGVTVITLYIGPDRARSYELQP